MNYDEYLCLTELLDQDLSAYEFFQTLSPEEQTLLRRCSGGIASFSQLQAGRAFINGSPLKPNASGVSFCQNSRSEWPAPRPAGRQR